jgi:hypothetical protein
VGANNPARSSDKFTVQDGLLFNALREGDKGDVHFPKSQWREHDHQTPKRVGAKIMSARAVTQAVLFSLMVGIFSPAHAMTQQELIAKLEAAGYSQIREIKSIAEGISVKAMKNGKEVSLVVDSSGQIQERH